MSTAMTQAQRDLAYAQIVIELTETDPAVLEGRPPDQQFLILLKASEERGVTLKDWEGWAAQCNGADDPVACFRALAEPAYREPMSLGKVLTISGFFWFAVGFGATRLAQKRRR